MTFTIKFIAARAYIHWYKAVFGTCFCAFFASGALAALPIQKFQLANGAVVHLVESPAIAMLDVQIDFDGGSRRDPPSKVGLASMTAALLEKGVVAKNGQPALDENALGEAWADLGAQFGASAGSDRFSFSLRTLTEPDLLAKAVALAARQIAEPAFADDVWQRDKQKVIAGIKESDTRPATLARRAYSQAVYGGHPYGHEFTEAGVANIATADMRAFYQATVVACRARVNLVGAINRAQAEQIATAMLARLPQASPQAPCSSVPALPPVAEVQPLAEAVQKTIAFDAAQAQVLMGQPGYKRSDPAFFPLLVGNYILGGGGFVSRLMTEVREKRGLTYGVNSNFAPGMHAGAFTVSLQTRPDQAKEALEVARQVVRDFVATGPLDAEVKAAKDNLTGGFALLIDSNRKLLGNISNIAWYDLPTTYLDTWTAQIDKVTVQDVKAAMAAKLQPEKMVTVILGAKPSP
jgi:zinc protease